MKVAVISDVHSNLEALEAVLERLGGVERILCLGDLVGYGANPNECIALLRERRAVTIMGNHDRAALTGETAWFNDDAARSLHWTAGQLTRESRDFLAGLPEELRMEGLFAVHGSPVDRLEGYLLGRVAAAKALAVVRERLVVVGHTHIAGAFVGEDVARPHPFPAGGRLELRERAVVNPGSVGQPRDGNPQAAYAILDGDVVEFRRVDYAWEAASQKIRDAGLPGRFAKRLLAGV